MNMKKKFLCLFLAIFMLVATLASCSAGDDDVSEELEKNQARYTKTLVMYLMSETEVPEKTEKDIENFIKGFVEDIKKSPDQTDDEFMRLMFHTFIDKVFVSKERVTVHIRTDFSLIAETVTNEQLSGVIHSLPTVRIEKVINRKKHIHGKNI